MKLKGCLKMVDLREERLSDAMLKIHIGGLMGAAVFHDFTGVDGSDPHDHPWSFVSHVLFGGYVEEIYDLATGWMTRVQRKPDDVFFVDARTIHRVVELPEGRCQTLIKPREHVQVSGVYQWRDGGPWRKTWHHDAQWERVQL